MVRHESVAETSAAFISRQFGDAGRAWLATVPGELETLAEQWRLEVGEPLHGGLLSCVRRVTLGSGGTAVLKISGPWVRAGDEARALQAWRGLGAPHLLAWDPERRALLLEEIAPAGSAVEVSADAVGRLLHELHVAPPEGMRSIAELVGERLDRAEREGRSNPRRIAWARAAAGRLEATSSARVLVHGDFDDRNLLYCSRRGLCAVDPLPCAGDPAYDAGTWVHSSGRKGRRARFDAIVAATGYPRARVRDWAAIVGVHG